MKRYQVYKKMAMELGLEKSVYAYVPQPLSAPTVVDGDGGSSQV